MQSGLAKLGYAGLILILLVPLLLIVGLRSGAHSYCVKAMHKVTEQNAAIVHAIEMEGALRQARAAIQAVKVSTLHDFTGTEDFGRWIHEAGKQQQLTLQNLTLNKDATIGQLTPAFTASFRVEQSLPKILLLLHNLQSPQRLVLYDAIHLHIGAPSDPQVYVADITLHSYALTSLKTILDP